MSKTRVRGAESDVPTYLRVADELETEVVRRAPGEPFASENEVAREFEVSRLTARAALEELERRYLVRRTQGRGTFVAGRLDYIIGPGTPPSWTRKVRLAGGSPRSETQSLGVRRATRAVRLALELGDETRAVQLLRRRYLDDQLAAFAESWLPLDLVPGIERALAPCGSLHELLDETYDLRPYAATQRAEQVIASPAVAKHLGVEGRPMVFQLHAVTRSATRERPIELTTTWMRADMFRVVFEMGDA